MVSNTLPMSVLSAPGPPTSTLSPPPPSAISRTPSTNASLASSSCPGSVLETGYMSVLPSSLSTPRGGRESSKPLSTSATCPAATSRSPAVSPPSRWYTSTRSVDSPPGNSSWIRATCVESALSGR